MGRVVFAIYKPFQNKENELLELVKVHFDVLKTQDLITDRKRIVLKSKNGEIIEIFEWKNKEAIETAHTNEQVMTLWNKFEKACSYENLNSLKESQEIFTDFEVMDL